MAQILCPHCRGAMLLTKRLRFPDGALKFIYECAQCARAQVVAKEPEPIPSESA